MVHSSALLSGLLRVLQGISLAGIKLSDVIHVVAGIVAGLLNIVNPLVSLQLVLLFISYEFLEQLRVGDKGWLDILEFTLGWLAGTTVVL
ncbi:MAG: hypothetical protein DRO14_04685 [Thermoprotei archaeon]|nr:MAG: hypothetical protein DRO14_04685 [Thermoprotei archaeon]